MALQAQVQDAPTGTRTDVSDAVLEDFTEDTDTAFELEADGNFKQLSKSNFFSWFGSDRHVVNNQTELDAIELNRLIVIAQVNTSFGDYDKWDILIYNQEDSEWQVLVDGVEYRNREVEHVDVDSQSDLDALVLEQKFVLARVTTAFGSYQLDDLLVYDTISSEWEIVVDANKLVQDHETYPWSHSIESTYDSTPSVDQGFVFSIETISDVKYLTIYGIDDASSSYRYLQTLENHDEFAIVDTDTKDEIYRGEFGDDFDSDNDRIEIINFPTDISELSDNEDYLLEFTRSTPDTGLTEKETEDVVLDIVQDFAKAKIHNTAGELVSVGDSPLGYIPLNRIYSNFPFPWRTEITNVEFFSSSTNISSSSTTNLQITIETVSSEKYIQVHTTASTYDVSLFQRIKKDDLIGLYDSEGDFSGFYVVLEDWDSTNGFKVNQVWQDLIDDYEFTDLAYTLRHTRLIDVSASVKVDDSTIEQNNDDQLRVKSGGLDNTHVSSSISVSGKKSFRNKISSYILTTGGSVPTSPNTNDLHLYDASASSLSNHRNNDDSSDITSAGIGDIFKWDGTNWILEYTPITYTNFTTGSSVPTSPNINDLHLYDTSVSSLSNHVGNDGTTAQTSAIIGEIFKWDGTNWVSEYKPSTDTTIRVGLVHKRSKTYPGRPRGTYTSGVKTLQDGWLDYVPLNVGGSGVLTDTKDLHANNTNATGITGNDDVVLILDQTDNAIYVYNNEVVYQRLWTLNINNTTATGIWLEPDGSVLWVADASTGNLLVYKYTLDSDYVGTLDTSFSISVTPAGITGDVDYLYILNDTDNKLNAFTRSGTATTSADIDLSDETLTGVDLKYNRIYSTTSGATDQLNVHSLDGTSQDTEDFDLDSSNGNPHGVAIIGLRTYVVDNTANDIFIYGSDNPYQDTLYTSEYLADSSDNTIEFSDPFPDGSNHLDVGIYKVLPDLVGGTANAITVRIPGITEYSENLIIRFRVKSTNTGNVTLQVNSLSAVSLRRSDGSQLESGDIEEDLDIVVQYNPSDSVFHSDVDTIKASNIQQSMTGANQKIFRNRINVSNITRGATVPSTNLSDNDIHIYTEAKTGLTNHVDHDGSTSITTARAYSVFVYDLTNTQWVLVTENIGTLDDTNISDSIDDTGKKNFRDKIDSVRHTTGNAVPSDPNTDDLHTYDTDVTSLTDHRANNGTTEVTTASRGDLFKYNGTLWIREVKAPSGGIVAGSVDDTSVDSSLTTSEQSNFRNKIGASEKYHTSLSRQIDTTDPRSATTHIYIENDTGNTYHVEIAIDSNDVINHFFSRLADETEIEIHNSDSSKIWTGVLTGIQDATSTSATLVINFPTSARTGTFDTVDESVTINIGFAPLTTRTDDTTIEHSSSGQLQVKSGSIDKGHLNSDIVDDSTIENDSTDGLRVKEGGLRDEHIADDLSDTEQENVRRKFGSQTQWSDVSNPIDPFTRTYENDSGVSTTEARFNSSQSQWEVGAVDDSDISDALEALTTNDTFTIRQGETSQEYTVSAATSVSGTGNTRHVVIPVNSVSPTPSWTDDTDLDFEFSNISNTRQTGYNYVRFSRQDSWELFTGTDVSVDDTTIENDSTDGLRVKAGGIDQSHIKSDMSDANQKTFRERIGAKVQWSTSAYPYQITKTYEADRGSGGTLNDPGEASYIPPPTVPSGWAIAVAEDSADSEFLEGLTSGQEFDIIQGSTTTRFRVTGTSDVQIGSGTAVTRSVTVRSTYIGDGSPSYTDGDEITIDFGSISDTRQDGYDYIRHSEDDDWQYFEQPFDIHDDLTEELTSLADDDRIAVSDESDAGDPMKYTQISTIRDRIALVDDTTIERNSSLQLQIKHDGVDNDHLANDSVRTSTIEDGAITKAKMADDSVGENELEDDSVDKQHLNPDIVDDTTIENDDTDGLQVKEGGIRDEHIAGDLDGTEQDNFRVKIGASRRFHRSVDRVFEAGVIQQDLADKVATALSSIEGVDLPEDGIEVTLNIDKIVETTETYTGRVASTE